jgi:hypothetical protein
LTRPKFIIQPPPRFWESEILALFIEIERIEIAKLAISTEIGLKF